jgi:hypothetical protein
MPLAHCLASNSGKQSLQNRSQLCVEPQMMNPEWTCRGKSVAQLIEELRTFENQGMEARISIDGGATSLPISLHRKADGKFALLTNCQDAPTSIEHGK